MKRGAEVVAAGALAAVLAFGCCLGGCKSSGRIEVGESAVSAQERTALSFFGFMVGKSKIEEIDQAMSMFMRENPGVAVSYEGLSTNDGYARILDQRLETGNADDVFMVNPQVLRTYADKGYVGSHLVDLSDRSDLVSAYSDEVLAMVTYGETVPALPMAVGAFGMYVNRDLLKAHGIDRAPETLDEFLDDCARLKAEGIVPIAASSRAEGFTAKVLALGRSFACDPELFNLKSSGGTISRPDLAAAMEPGCELAEELTSLGYWDVEAAAAAAPGEDDVAAFAGGAYAFLPSASWTASSLRQEDPAFAWEFIGLPVADDGRIAMIRPTACVAVSVSGDHRDESLGLMRFLASEDAIVAFTRGRDGISPLKNGAVESESVIDLVDLMAEGRAYCDCSPRYSFDLYSSIGPELAMVMDGRQDAVDVVRKLSEEAPAS